MIVFILKQKTAYEMRISDWSSDVCSSDLEQGNAAVRQQIHAAVGQQTLGRHVQQIQIARQKRLLDLARRAPVLRGVQESGAHAQFDQRIDLVLHQGDKR